jgi:D-aminopeptidase
MRVLIVTDLEGVNGVLNFNDWCVPQGRRNEAGCRFLTEEVNAAVAGFFEAGATEVIVADGHGSGGSIRGEFLDPRAALQRGVKVSPIFNDECDAAAFVGQHAKAGTPDAHLAHTQTEEAVDFRINGVSLGEFGQLSYAFYERGIPVIFASGDLALTFEARELIPGIFTSAVKEGYNTALDSTCPASEVFSRESTAVHYPRAGVLKNIRQQSALAMQKFLTDPGAFAIKPLAGPYRAEAEYRATSPKLIPEVGALPPRRIRTSLHDTVAGAFNEFYGQLEWAVVEEGEHFTLL